MLRQNVYLSFDTIVKRILIRVKEILCRDIRTFWEKPLMLFLSLIKAEQSSVTGKCIHTLSTGELLIVLEQPAQ